jgi:membrane-associated protease RseP (regulator of RpoE activity)
MIFTIIDLALLVIFLLFVVFFLKKNKKNIGKEGSLILYRTQWGVKLIEKIGKNYKKTLRILSYVSVFCGFALMAMILYLVGKSVWDYLTTSISEIISAPPIVPLIPYFPQLFGLESFFPPFLFIFFILAVGIVATVHEFSHGIFAKRYGVRIKSTGFAFLKWFPALFGAFVEQDDKQMLKKTKFQQMSILSAGVFANLIAAVFFVIILLIFFFSFFSLSGVQIISPAFTFANVSQIEQINNQSVSNFEEILQYSSEESLDEVLLGEEIYFSKKEFLMLSENSSENVILFYDSPILKNSIYGTIKELNGVEILDISSLSLELEKYSPGNSVILKTIFDGKVRETEIVLGKNPSNKSKAFLGFSTSQKTPEKIMQIAFAYRMKDSYEINSEIIWNIYYLLWWIIVINFLVALFNMLPLGILDGGRFLYLGIWTLTGKENAGKKVYLFFTYLLLFLLALMLARWVIRFI